MTESMPSRSILTLTQNEAEQLFLAAFPGFNARPDNPYIIVLKNSEQIEVTNNRYTLRLRRDGWAWAFRTDNSGCEYPASFLLPRMMRLLDTFNIDWT